MNQSFRQGPAVKPVAVLIAAQMRITMPKAAQTQGHAPVSVKHALKNAANSSPAAKAAFKQAAPAVKAAAPHLKALAQPGRGLISSLRHGVSTMRSLRQVARAMAGETPSAAQSVKSAFKTAASSSPTAAAAFKGAGPAVAKAQKHVAALSRMQQSPNPGLLSSLGHGFQAMRALRQVTRGMQNESAQPSLMPSIKSVPDAPEAPRPGLLSTFGQSVQMLRALRGTTRSLAGHEFPGQSSAIGSTENSVFVSASASAKTSQSLEASPFALMLIARRSGKGLSSFKDMT